MYIMRTSNATTSLTPMAVIYLLTRRCRVPSTSALAWLMSNRASLPGINFSKQTAIDKQQNQPTKSQCQRVIASSSSLEKTWEYANLIKMLNAAPGRCWFDYPRPLAVWRRSRAKIRPCKVRPTRRFRLIQQCPLFLLLLASLMTMMIRTLRIYDDNREIVMTEKCWDLCPDNVTI